MRCAATAQGAALAGVIPEKCPTDGWKNGKKKTPPFPERFSVWPLDIPRGTERNAPGIQPRERIIAQMFEFVNTRFAPACLPTTGAVKARETRDRKARP